GTVRMCESPLHRNEPNSTPVHLQDGAAGDSMRITASVDPSRLERRDLGEVEDIPDVDARACHLDPAKAVDGEVAERMRRRGGRDDQRSRDGRDEEQTLHGCLQYGLVARERANHDCAAARWPRQRSITPRWKNLGASSVPSRSARLE